MTELIVPQFAVPPRKIKGYGFRRSLGLMGEPQANIAGIKVLLEVDPRKDLQQWVLNQLQLGSCTSQATSTCFRYDKALDGHDPGQLCRLWIYRGERILEGVLGQGDTGAMGHDAFTVAKHGIPSETDWPYDIATFEHTPPAAAVKDQQYYVLKKSVAAVPQNLHAFQAVLSNKQTIAFGFTVYESFESSEVARTGIVPMPQQGEQVLGGHEVLLVGYIKGYPHHALVMNSWGLGWGIKGFFLMPWTYLLDPQLSSDFRTITRPLAK